MKTYRFQATMAGVLYLLGTVFGVLSIATGGDVVAAMVAAKPLSGPELLGLIAVHPERLLGGSFLILMMGLSLVGMTVFLYPIFRKDSEELALGLLLFRGALEGAWYFASAMGVLVLFALGSTTATAQDPSGGLEILVDVVHRSQDLMGPIGTLFFLVGASCLYVSFYRTKLIPRWLSVWGMVGVVPYLAYALLHFFRIDNGIGLYLQMVLAPQEMVMALWLIIGGFDRGAIMNLMAPRSSESVPNP